MFVAIRACNVSTALKGRLVAELTVVTAGPQLLQAIADRVILA
jgi:hypothetical protein